MPADSRDLVLVPRWVFRDFLDNQPGWPDTARRYLNAPAASPARGEGDACPVCGCEERTGAGYLQCECPAPSTASTTERPMKLLVDQDWLDRRVENDPELPCEATPSPGEGDAPVAWRHRRRNHVRAGWVYGEVEGAAGLAEHYDIQPLYTHPTPATPAGEELREAIEHLRECVKLVPAPGAIERAEAFLAALQPQAEGE